MLWEVGFKSQGITFQCVLDCNACSERVLGSHASTSPGAPLLDYMRQGKPWWKPLQNLNLPQTVSSPWDTSVSSLWYIIACFICWRYRLSSSYAVGEVNNSKSTFNLGTNSKDTEHTSFKLFFFALFSFMQYLCNYVLDVVMCHGRKMWQNIHICYFVFWFWITTWGWKICPCKSSFVLPHDYTNVAIRKVRGSLYSHHLMWVQLKIGLKY